MKVFGSSGVRGVATTELAPADTLRVAQALGNYLDPDRVAVGKDTRRTGELYVDSVASGLASVGCDVDRLGIVPTPGLQVYCEQEGIPGIMVTASHNPPEFNGLKLVGQDGIELTSDTLERIEARLSNTPERASWDTTGTSRRIDNACQRYVDQLLAAVETERIADAELTVAVDPGHGAGSATTPDILQQLGCTVKTVNAQPDGRFPGRNPEPVPSELSALRRLVKTADADLGIAHDGDADRAIFVDETGSHIEGDAMLAALAAEELSAGDTVVSAVNASQRLVDVAQNRGATLALTPIGSTYIITRIRSLRDAGESIPIAGEGNGGVFFPGYRISRDGAYTAVRFLELLTDQTAREVIAPYDDYENVRTNLTYTDSTERTVMTEAIASTARESDADVDTTDGYRLDYGDSWVLARPSGTEPIIRIYAEARNRDRAVALAGMMEDRIEKARSG